MTDTTERALRRQLDEALTTIEALRQALPPARHYEVPVEWRLTKSEERLFLAFLDNRRGDKEHLYATLYGDREDAPDIQIVDIFICKLRKKLTPFGVNIVTVWGRGYALDDRDGWRERLAVREAA